MPINIGIVDDHHLFSKSLELMLSGFKGFRVVLISENGLDLQHKLNSAPVLPDIMLIDVAMPVMDGFETAKWLKTNFPFIKLTALSMNDNDQSVINMFKAGCCAYLFKDIHPDEFEQALNQIYSKGFYNSDRVQLHFSQMLEAREESKLPLLTAREMDFLLCACSDMTYVQIAEAMNLSKRTIDGYRESVFQKFNVQSRTGMALEAIRRGLIKI
jgi:DNA-binding NarL/FixJ family response regulator